LQSILKKCAGGYETGAESHFATRKLYLDDVADGSKADIADISRNVRFSPNSDMKADVVDVSDAPGMDNGIGDWRTVRPPTAHEVVALFAKRADFPPDRSANFTTDGYWLCAN